MQPAINILKQTRQLLVTTVKGLTPEQFLTIPPGFDNNIAWNVAHVVVVQQRLHYKLTNTPPYLSAEHMAMFAPGTSPATWTEPPDMAFWLEQLLLLPEKLEADYTAGRLGEFQPYTTTTGVRLNTLEETLVFNNYHEGLHFGFILALKNIVTA